MTSRGQRSAFNGRRRSELLAYRGARQRDALVTARQMQVVDRPTDYRTTRRPVVEFRLPATLTVDQALEIMSNGSCGD